MKFYEGLAYYQLTLWNSDKPYLCMVAQFMSLQLLYKQGLTMSTLVPSAMHN